MITQKQLKTLLYYNPKTGYSYWKIKRKGSKGIGRVAGTKRKTGYIQISINHKIHLAHRLAFLYMEGYLPENQVDHINRKPYDNRWENLREVSNRCNSINQKVRFDSISGVTGVGWDNRSSKWRSRIMVYGKDIDLGLYLDLSHAVMARHKAEVQYKFPECHKSSAYQYLLQRGLL